MVRRALLLPLLLLALLLPGCSFFTASLFPGYLAQAEKSYDLGSSIENFLVAAGSANYRWYSQVSVLTTDAGVDYGAVLIEIDSLPNKRLVLVDPQGGKFDFSTPIPNPSPPPDNFELGRLNLKDANGRFVVGCLAIDPNALPAFSTMQISNVNAQGFSDPVSARNFLLWTSDIMSTGELRTLDCQTFTSTWSAGTTTQVLIDGYGSFELRGAWYDPSAPAGPQVIMAFVDYMSNNRVLVILAPFSDFAGGFTSVTTSLREYYPKSLQFDNLDVNNVIYTRKGIVLVDWDGNATLMDFSGNETGKKLDLGQRGEVRLDLDIEGDHFYVFNPEDQMLYRGRTGW